VKAGGTMTYGCTHRLGGAFDSSEGTCLPRQSLGERPIPRRGLCASRAWAMYGGTPDSSGGTQMHHRDTGERSIPHGLQCASAASRSKTQLPELPEHPGSNTIARVSSSSGCSSRRGQPLRPLVPQHMFFLRNRTAALEAA